MPLMPNIMVLAGRKSEESDRRQPLFNADCGLRIADLVLQSKIQKPVLSLSKDPKSKIQNPKSAVGGRILSLLVLLLLAALHPVQAQVSPAFYDYARPTLDWYQIETEHFQVLFHADTSGTGSSRTAQVAARVAEEVYEPITSLYQYEPNEKVVLVLKDYEDYSNGAAYFFDNKIEIWAPALDSPLRGHHNWLRNVITHEFTHIVQVQAAMKQGRRLPFLYLQWLHYEDVKRPDVLYGYPDVIVTYPFATLNNPAWLAEGTAQYQRQGIDYDRWDSHRDMLLRTRILAGKELSLADMGGFYSHTSLLRESVYNHGFAFVQYLADTYGEDALRRVTEALGQWGNWNVERALHDALGIPGEDVYRQWIDTLRTGYEARTADIRAHLVEGQLIEPDGFSNFYPRFSPDGTRLAYISNKGEDFSRTALYVRDLESGQTTTHVMDGLEAATDGFTCSLGHRVRSGVQGAFSWRPDGQAIVYAHSKDTRLGYLYDDLYVYDLTTRKARRLTTDQRATMPAYAPDGARIAFVRQEDGTANLALLDVASGEIVPLTRYADGTQVSDPVWHPNGTWIYFAASSQHGRDLFRIRTDGSDLQPVVQTDADERTPAIDRDGRYLYYASDASGIFNLYRLPLDENAGSNEPERLTNVIGGAFMPAVGPDGSVAFARYDWDGYKIAQIGPEVEGDALAGGYTYSPPPVLHKQKGQAALASSEWDGLNTYDDADLHPLASDALTAVGTEGFFPLGDVAAGGEIEAPDLEVEAYRNGLFTSFSFFPVVRMDEYALTGTRALDEELARRGRAETMLRNLKVGTYVASREMLDGFSMLGGLLVGPASTDASSLLGTIAPTNLLEMERDLFLQFDYRKGLGLIPQRWSPQFTLEFYNIRRNVERGLSIEEFPCTACFPDTTFADLSYNLWEASVAARSKVNRYLLLEAAYRYSPYKVTTKGFFSREFQQPIESSSSRYFIGRALRLAAYLEAYKPHRNQDVVPSGLEVEASYEYEPSQLLDRFEVEDGLLVPEYARYRNHRVLLDARYGLPLVRKPGGIAHGLSFRLRATSILGETVDDFFDDYVGGLIGARGYPFYALGGNETFWAQASYHFPLLPDIRRQMLFLYIDKLYGRVYADAAAAWSGPWSEFGPLRKDVGAELRLALGSFYLLPTAVFLSTTYGLDSFDFQLDDGFVTPDGRTFVRYGGEVLWHFGVLFEFDL